MLHGILAAIGVRQPGDDTFIKRVVGRPGETVEGREGRVFIDGEPLNEPYLRPGVVTSDFPPVHLGKDQLFLMGDNRPNSSDSRSFGPVDRSRLVAVNLGSSSARNRAHCAGRQALSDARLLDTQIGVGQSRRVRHRG